MEELTQQFFGLIIAYDEVHIFLTLIIFSESYDYFFLLPVLSLTSFKVP